MKSYILRILVVVGVGLAITGPGPNSGSIALADEATHHTATFKVEGMSCEGCANGLVESLKQVEGVKDVVVHFTEAKAVVVYTPEMLTTDELLDAIGKRGFTPELESQQEGDGFYAEMTPSTRN